jgi:hypothetical protein
MGVYPEIHMGLEEDDNHHNLYTTQKKTETKDYSTYHWHNPHFESW